MSKLDELTGFLTAHNNPSVREAGYKMKALIGRVEELERQLQSARELAGSWTHNPGHKPRNCRANLCCLPTCHRCQLTRILEGK